MDRVVGIETEYGCLVSEEEAHLNSELWPAKVKNYLFRVFEKMGFSTRIELVLCMLSQAKRPVAVEDSEVPPQEEELSA